MGTTGKNVGNKNRQRDVLRRSPIAIFGGGGSRRRPPTCSHIPPNTLAANKLSLSYLSLYYIVVVVRHTILSAPLLNNNSSSGCWDRITTLADTMRHSRPTLSLLCRVWERRPSMQREIFDAESQTTPIALLMLQLSIYNTARGVFIIRMAITYFPWQGVWSKYSRKQNKKKNTEPKQQRKNWP